MVGMKGECLWLGFLVLAVGYEVSAESSEAVPGTRQLNVVGIGDDPLYSIAGYVPQATVMDQARIDLDQADIIQAFSFNSFSDARAIYEQGAHSLSVATIQLDTPLQRDMLARSVVSGKTQSGRDLVASLLSYTPARATTLDIVYPVSTEEGAPQCQAGGSIVPKTDGCLQADGIVTIGGLLTLSYSYDTAKGNQNFRSIQGFSIDSSDLFLDCQRCPLATHQKFVTYYGDFSYADDFIQAALDGGKTNFDRGNVNFTNVGFAGRGEAVQRFTVYLNIWMFVVGRMEFSIEACEQMAVDTISYWDQAVAFYAGSLEGSDGSGTGNLLYHLADELCPEFGTCDENGTSKVNRDILDEFKAGQSKLTRSDCNGAEGSKNRIVALMSIPMIQGVFLYIVKSNKDERDQAAGFCFASAVLPLIYDCDKESVDAIYDPLSNPQSSAAKPAIALPLIKVALESNYECLGISCEDVGDVNGQLCGRESPRTPGEKDPDSKEDTEDGDEEDDSESNSVSMFPAWLSLAIPAMGVMLLFQH